MEGGSAVETKIKKHVMKAICILSAIGLWLYVSYTENPEMHVWLRDVPIAYTGAEALLGKDLACLEADAPKEVHVKISGRRSSLMRLRDADVHASVNYADIPNAGTYTLPIHISLPQNDLWVSKLSESTVTLTADALVTVEKSIAITTDGAEKLGLSDFAASPSTIRVTGPKSILENLKASVHIDLTGGQNPDTHAVVLTTEDGDVFDEGIVTLTPQSVSVSATRELPIVIEPAGLPADATLEKTVCEPERTTVRGELPVLLRMENVRGAYSVWADFSASPATTGQVPLVYPADVTPLGPASARASFYLQTAEE